MGAIELDPVQSHDAILIVNDRSLVDRVASAGRRLACLMQDIIEPVADIESGRLLQPAVTRRLDGSGIRINQSINHGKDIKSVRRIS